MLVGSDLKTQQPDHERNVRKHNNNFISSSVASNNKSDSKRFFSFIKSKRNENVGISPLCENSIMKITDKVKA